MSDFLKSIAGGMCISIGCIAFLSVESNVLGAFLFSCGLLAIVSLQTNLFTGKVCYAQPTKESLRFVLIVLAGNLAGALLTALLAAGSGFAISAEAAAAKRLAETPLEVLCRGVFCNIMIYLAVEGYKRTKNALIIVLPVMVFILCGFEHCVANMFYLAYAGRLFTPAGLWFLLLNIIGNSAGGIGMNFIATWAPVKK